MYTSPPRLSDKVKVWVFSVVSSRHRKIMGTRGNFRVAGYTVFHMFRHVFFNSTIFFLRSWMLDNTNIAVSDYFSQSKVVVLEITPAKVNMSPPERDHVKCQKEISSEPTTSFQGTFFSFPGCRESTLFLSRSTITEGATKQKLIIHVMYNQVVVSPQDVGWGRLPRN